MNRIDFNKIAFLIVAFLIVLIPSLWVPMQSDDYSYYLMGLSPSAHLEHYLGWSGRVVTNIISTTLLSTMPHFVYETVNSIAFALLTLFITVVPITNKNSNKATFFVRSAFIFVLYWIANPNLGQTSFWIVGSANYMWTNMFIAGYFAYLIRSVNKNRFCSISLALLSFLAGCSNENTATVVVLVTIFIVFYEKTSSKIKVISISGSLVGALLLILAPGNRVRASHFEYWNSLSFIQKVQIHFFDRFPQAVSEYWQVYLVIISAVLVASFSGTLRKNTIVYMTMFFVASILANAAFIGSPVLPPRSMNGALCFLLISLSFALVDATNSREKFGYGLLSAVGMLCAFYFLPSYYLFNKAMHATYEQAKIREKIVLTAKSHGQSDVKIPEFYFPQLAKYYDRFDTYHSKALARYYGVKSTEMFRIGFDYSQINKAKYISVNKSFFVGYSLEKIYFYSENLGMKNMALLEFSGPINQKASAGDRVFMHIYRKGHSGFINADVEAYPTVIDGRYFTWRDIGKAKLEDIEKINIGIYNTNTKLRKFEYTITP
ncbi:TPA: hypothetical protein OL861_001473 [Proteus mirabilis]|uniref:DUF6056 family protein n=1 Tax=Proteus mirabilis TaxID=584 RepID=UPI0021D8DB98|nr:DUF6056 family protein [Proteus mirabilis]MCU9571386.1 DUF6056 family protein [Proteus mirabilis]HCQ7980294.1 hypothetical protein [Proteus mirabilis]HCQ8187693.1 hypothetical protein [Proteus mirabilis]HEK0391964.1 hypothetical protein [Proteus mirabilis]